MLHQTNKGFAILRDYIAVCFKTGSVAKLKALSTVTDTPPIIYSQDGAKSADVQTATSHPILTDSYIIII